MAVQYYNANVVNPTTGEKGMWYFTDITTETAVDLAAAGAGTYRLTEGDLPVMTDIQKDMTTEQFYETYNPDYPSFLITPEGVVEEIPPAWSKERILPDASERLEHIKEFEVLLGIGVPEGTTGFVSAGVLTAITDYFYSISSWFYEIYLEVLGWVYPFWLGADLFYKLSEVFVNLAWNFENFFSTFEDIAQRVTELLSWGAIWSYILSYVPNLEAIRDWFYNWWYNVNSVLTSWWSATQYTVRGWIDIATEGLATLKVSWSNFSTVTLPTLVSFNWLETWWNNRLGDIQGLISSAFMVRESFWSGWQDWRDKVTEFFTDPDDWLYKAFDRIIERFW